ncbi:MAG: ABC transporter permease subunit [Phycisphaerales bacterium]|nr:ABC transporter permease subunit [Phycisphaerales bacterium]
MSGTLAIARRDLLAAFATPAGWVVMALFALLTALVFMASSFHNGEPANLRAVLLVAGWAMVAMAPAISMRSISDELRQGTYETLATAPVGEAAIVLGKFIACVCFLLAMLAPTIVLIAMLELYGRPDYGELLCGLLGLLLAGAACMALGVLASTLTASQIVAYLVALLALLATIIGLKALATVTPSPYADLVFAADPVLRLRDFTIGLLDSAGVVYFVAIVAALLVTATQSLRLRRSL